MADQSGTVTIISVSSGSKRSAGGMAADKEVTNKKSAAEVAKQTLGFIELIKRRL